MPEQADLILKKLAGGDHRSIGRCAEVVRDIAKDPSQFETLFKGMLSADSLVRMRAADAVEKITRLQPQLLAPFKKQLLEQVAGIGQKEVRWHVAQIFPRLSLNRSERAAAVEILLSYLKDKSSLVKTFALQALAELAQRDPGLGACRK